MGAFLNRLNPLAKVDARINEEVAEKTLVAYDTAMAKLRADMPGLAALLQGKRVTIAATIQITAE